MRSLFFSSIFTFGPNKLELLLFCLFYLQFFYLKIIGEDIEIVNLAPNWQSSMRA